MAAVECFIAEMEDLKEKDVRSLIGSFYETHHDKGKKYTVKHFREMDVPQSTIYSVMKRFDDGGTAARKSGSGRVATKLPSAAKKRLLKAVNGKDKMSQRKLASKFNVSQPYVSHVLKEGGVKYYKKKKSPLHNT